MADDDEGWSSPDSDYVNTSNMTSSTGKVAMRERSMSREMSGGKGGRRLSREIRTSSGGGPGSAMAAAADAALAALDLGGDGDGGGDDDDDGGRIFQAHPSRIPLRPGIKYPVRVNPHSDIYIYIYTYVYIYTHTHTLL